MSSRIPRNNRIPRNSRYAAVEVATHNLADGTEITYLRRRFIPASARFSALFEHHVARGDRLDNLTAQYMDDPEQFWRLCDANDVLHPEELTETIGRRVRITLPEGIEGAGDA